MATKKGHDQRYALVLAGGGIDSTVCIYQLVQEGFCVRALHIDYGQLARIPEWESVCHTAACLSIEVEQVVVAPSIHRVGPEIRGRNAALVSLGLLYSLPRESLICIGVHSGTSFFDCSPTFVESIGRLVAEQTDSQVRLIAPLISLTKPQIVAHADRLNVPLGKTYSCQNGSVPPCGKCHSCLDRKALRC